MSLSERRIQKSVNIVSTKEGMIAEILWLNQIIKDGVVFAETNHRCAYSAEDIERFLSEVENAEQYIAVLGWEASEPEVVEPEETETEEE